MFDIYYRTSQNSQLECLNSGEDGEALLTEALEMAWEEPAAPDMGFIILGPIGRLFAAATVVKVISESEGIFEIYRPGQPLSYVRATYILDSNGRYERTEVVATDPT